MNRCLGLLIQPCFLEWAAAKRRDNKRVGGKSRITNLTGECHLPSSLKFTLPMPPVMSHAEWMDRTTVSMKIRGPRLRELDAAIRFFETAKSEGALIGVAKALLAWIDQAHPNGDFLESKRNNHHAIGLLLPVLNWYFSDPRRREMLEALRIQKERYQEKEMLLYKGKRVEFKLQTRGVLGKAGAQLVNEFATFVLKIGAALGIVDKEAKELANNPEFQRRFRNAFNILHKSFEDISVIRNSRHSSGPLGWILDAIPGVTLASSLVSLVEADRARRRSAIATVLFMDSSPEYVFTGLTDFFEREVQYQGRRVCGAVVDIATLFVPGIQLASLVKNVAMLCAAILDFMRDYREKQAANAILAGPEAITPDVFSVCPVLAAYHICSLDTAATAFFLFNERSQFFSYDFKEKIEQYNKGILVPIKNKARDLLHKSDLVLVPGGIPLVSLKSDLDQMAEQHGWWWWKFRNACRIYKQLRSQKISDYTGKSIEGPTPESKDSKAA
jgi:hypothetical protein